MMAKEKKLYNDMDGKSFETTLPCIFQGNYSVSAKSPGGTFQELIFLCILPLCCERQYLGPS